MQHCNRHSILAKTLWFTAPTVESLLSHILECGRSGPLAADFTSEVTSALRLTDGALVVASVFGISAQSEITLLQAIFERVKPVLTLNKLQLLLLARGGGSPEKFYQELLTGVESVNSVIGKPNVEALGDTKVDPGKDNVAFGSSLQWRHSLWRTSWRVCTFPRRHTEMDPYCHSIVYSPGRLLLERGTYYGTQLQAGHKTDIWVKHISIAQTMLGRAIERANAAVPAGNICALRCQLVCGKLEPASAETICTEEDAHCIKTIKVSASPIVHCNV